MIEMQIALFNILIDAVAFQLILSSLSFLATVIGLKRIVAQKVL